MMMCLSPSITAYLGIYIHTYLPTYSPFSVDKMSADGGKLPDYPRFVRGRDSVLDYFNRLFRERIVIYDGAMGTMIQKHRLTEEDYRVSR